MTTEFENLARWLKSIHARAIQYGSSISTSTPDGRPDYIDEQHESLNHACKTLSKIEVFYASYPLYALVLWYAFVKHKDVRRSTLGILFAPVKTQTEWLYQTKNMLLYNTQSYGEKLLEDATRRWETFVTDETVSYRDPSKIENEIQARELELQRLEEKIDHEKRVARQKVKARFKR